MVIIWSLFIGSRNILLLLHHNVWKWPKWKSLIIRWYLSSFQNTVPRLLRVSLQEGTKTRRRKAVCLIELWDFRNPLLASLPASVSSSSSFHFWLDSLDKHSRKNDGREISISCCLFGKIYSLSSYHKSSGQFWMSSSNAFLWRNATFTFFAFYFKISCWGEEET